MGRGQVAGLRFAEQGKAAEALTEVEAFQRRLASVRILDPACGWGNFLYVTLEDLKWLEGEVLEVRRSLGEGQMLLEMEGSMVRPEQFHGIEVNPWAAAIAELVLWIGFLQWHRRTRGDVCPPSRSCVIGTTSSAATRCWPGTRPSRCWMPPASP